MCTRGVTILTVIDVRTEGGTSSCPGDLFPDNDLTILMISVSLVGDLIDIHGTIAINVLNFVDKIWNNNSKILVKSVGNYIRFF